MKAQRQSKPPAIRTVETPEALSALRAWIGTFEAGTRSRGREYWERGAVEDVWADADHFVEAEVIGQAPYDVSLFCTRGKWTSQCSCPMTQECKHVYAAALAWIADVETGGAGARKLQAATVEVSAPGSPAATNPALKRHPFRERWAPVIAEKLGRPLAESEARQLDQLASLFAEYSNSSRMLYPGALDRHGFSYTPLPPRAVFRPLFSGWWDWDDAPADAWALWQYIAYDYEQSGRPIPEVFRPMTDTGAIHEMIGKRVVNEEVARWKHALASQSSQPANDPAHALTEVTGLRVRLDDEGNLWAEARLGAGKPWKDLTQKILRQIGQARPADFEHLPPSDSAVGNALSAEIKSGARILTKSPLGEVVAASLLRTRAARDSIVLPNEKPFAIEPKPLLPEAMASARGADWLDLRLVTPDGRDASSAAVIASRPDPLYLFEGRIWRGPPPAPAKQIPVLALNDTKILTRLRAAGLRMPSSFKLQIQSVDLRPLLKCWLDTSEETGNYGTYFRAQLFARSTEPPCSQQWNGSGGWQWTASGAPPARGPDDPVLEIDLSAAQAVSTRLAEFRLSWDMWAQAWSRSTTKTFPEEFLAWHATLPPGLEIETSPELSSLFGPPLRGRVEFTAAAADDTNRDWFDLTVALRVEDTTLTPAEIALLLKARGKWVSLPKIGWRRLELADDGSGNAASDALERLGLGTADVLAGGKATTHRLHALQLAAEATTLESRDAALAATLRDRAAELAASPPPKLPTTLRAKLRPYQLEGFHFLVHLSTHGFGGVLADDMGLGKTVQTLAWLLHLRSEGSSSERAAAKAAGTQAASTATPFRTLVVCPKSVTHGWLTETARFAPSLAAIAFTPALADKGAPPKEYQLVIVNYTQLRLHAPWFQRHTWDAVVLDEGQFIKNPGSQVAAVSRSLVTRHRLVLTGTPIENRLTDLWSLFAFAQPGLLGTQPAFRRQYPDDEPAAHQRLHRRIRHFLLRRTKTEAAPDLPPRTEDDIVVELEGEQRRLYDAELKRARAQLLGIATDRALDSVRFNILASLLRLRQICCHPGLIDPAHRSAPSAKLEALMERLEELRDEGHQVLVFSQFVEMLSIIRDRLTSAGIGHLILTGATENRAELVEQFQRDRSKTVFLLSLKAAGFGLNLTAASYAVLYDPWWNPAVEAQAIDRTHRIGQTKPVIAYRLLAADSVEQKIRALQKEKAALANAVVQEESLANVLDLDSLRRILA